MPPGGSGAPCACVVPAPADASKATNSLPRCCLRRTLQDTVLQTYVSPDHYFLQIDPEAGGEIPGLLHGICLVDQYLWGDCDELAAGSRDVADSRCKPPATQLDCLHCTTLTAAHHTTPRHTTPHHPTPQTHKPTHRRHRAPSGGAGG